MEGSCAIGNRDDIRFDADFGKLLAINQRAGAGAKAGLIG
jgi:hypothetical protein